MEEYYEKLTANQMLIKLGRYAFNEKINSLQIYSRALLDDRLDVLKPTYKPWELDSFLYLILYSNENYTQYTIPSKQWNKDFIKIMQNIRFNTDNVINESSDLNGILMPINLQQVDDQNRTFFFEMYRANYVLTREEIKGTFEKLFYVSYEEISDLCFILFHLFKYSTPVEALLSVLDKYKKAVNMLTIDRDYFLEQDKQINKTLDNYNFCFKLFRAFPFIKNEKNCYIPLPHNFKYACSDSIFSRFTTFYDNKDDNDKLRKMLGHCFESYLFHILTLYYNESKVITEQEYTKQKNIVKSADCIVYDNDKIFMFDAKSSVPNTSLYINDQDQLIKKIGQYVECIGQMKKKIDDYGVYFKPEGFPPADKNDVYAIIVVLQDSYILRDKIYEEYFKQENIQDDSELALYVKSHIMIIDIKFLEKKLFYGYNIYDAIIKREHDELFNNYIFDTKTDKDKKYFLNETIKEFVETQCQRAIAEIKRLQNEGLMPVSLRRLAPDNEL